MCLHTLRQNLGYRLHANRVEDTRDYVKVFRLLFKLTLIPGIYTSVFFTVSKTFLSIISLYRTLFFSTTLKLISTSSCSLLTLVPTSEPHSNSSNSQIISQRWRLSRGYTWIFQNSRASAVWRKLDWAGSPQVGVIHSPLTRTIWGLRNGAGLRGDMS